MKYEYSLGYFRNLEVSCTFTSSVSINEILHNKVSTFTLVQHRK